MQNLNPAVLAILVTSSFTGEIQAQAPAGQALAPARADNAVTSIDAPDASNQSTRRTVTADSQKNNIADLNLTKRIRSSVVAGQEHIVDSLTIAMRSDIAMAGVVTSVIERHGGIAGLTRQFEQNGLRPTIQSWLIRGSNRPVTAEQIEQVMGPALIGELAAKTTLAPHSLAIRLAYLLPLAIDSLTSSGRLRGAEVT